MHRSWKTRAYSKLTIKKKEVKISMIASWCIVSSSINWLHLFGIISVNKPITRSLTSLCKMLDQQNSATVTRRPSSTPPLPPFPFNKKTLAVTQQPRQRRARQCLVPAPLPPPCCDSSNSLSPSPTPRPPSSLPSLQRTIAFACRSPTSHKS